MAWNPVGSIKGPKGDTGAPGAAGPQGAQGPVGPTGPAGATTIAGISGLQSELDARTPKDVSAVTEAALDGSEQVPVWRGGFLKTTVAKIGDWVSKAGWAWPQRQTFTAGVHLSSNTTAGVSAPDPSIYGPMLHVATNVKVDSSSLDDHSGVALTSTMPGNWGSSEIRMLGSVGWGQFNYSTPLLRASQARLSVPGYIAAGGGMQLGELSPTIKVKVVTGTLSATAGDTTTVAHGLGDTSKILGCVAVAQSGAVNRWFLPGAGSASSLFDFYFDENYVYVTTFASSSGLLGKPFKASIFYTP